MSLNGSLRKSLSNSSNFYNDINNNVYINNFNFPSSNSLRARYNVFDDNIISKNISIFEAQNPKSIQQRKEDLYEIVENSAEITDLASSRVESNFSTLNNLNNSLEINNNNLNYNNIKGNSLINISNNISFDCKNFKNNCESFDLDQQKMDTYQSLFNPLPCFENFKDLNLNDEVNYENNLPNSTSLKLNDICEDRNQRKSVINTVDVLTKEFMNRKIKNDTIKKREKNTNDGKLSNMKRIMKLQQKNNY